ncbi:predicted protein [Chaetoceros tenuissimus]|uniref:CCHC-type domain-containing protein n=1 Tax=Chaetoceros tenuissimus TaxID=426638 RepID=A0AAD3CXE1_9STRA|nr:predicted protein [Chaetoceros tenuissimus]
MLGIKGYVEAKRKRDMLWLLQSIKDTVYQFDKVKPSKLSSDDALERILKFHQGNLELAEFHKTFVNYIKVYEENTGYFSVTSKDILQLQKDLKDKGLSTDDYNLQFTEGIQDLRDHAVGIAFLKRADKSKYLELQNNLQSYQDINLVPMPFFLTSSPHDVIAGTDCNINENWICYRCGCPGHKSFGCPKSDAEAATSLAAA